MKDIVIVYHGNCPDGFGGAYAAWKKFGDQALYIGAVHGGTPPSQLEGKEVYFIDFSYTKDVLLEIEKAAKRLVILDHHMGAREAVEAVQEHMFDNDHSGSGIAWEYFHHSPLPRLLTYIEDNDLWRHSLPNGKAVSGYLSTTPFEFTSFDALVEKVQTDEGFADIIEKGIAYAEYYDFTVTHLEEYAQLVQFDEFTVLAANAPRLFRSELGHRLAKKHAPFSIVWYAGDNKWHCSLRGDGSIDVSEIARRRGGNGHHNAASFRVPFSEKLPFSVIPS